MGPAGRAVGAAVDRARGPAGGVSPGLSQASCVVTRPCRLPDVLASPAEQGASWWEGCEGRGAGVLWCPSGVG
eukprot:11648317-Alexandrium_andersonii.AAC.1